jgi:hypothetical protein
MRKIVAIDQNEKPGKYSNAASKMMPDGGDGFFGRLYKKRIIRKQIKINHFKVPGTLQFEVW